MSDITILGISFLSDASACVLHNGRLVSAVSEERLNRIKLWNGVPHKAIEQALKIAGISMANIDLVATHGEIPAESPAVRCEKKRNIILASTLDTAAKRLQLAALAEWEEKENRVRQERTPGYLREISAYGKPMFVTGHHEAHAASAFYGSGWENCVILTADGWGEDGSASLWKSDNGKMELISKTPPFDSLGYFYGSVTQSLGFIPHRHEGKVLGLAAYHQGLNRVYPLIQGMIAYDSVHQRFVGCMEAGLYQPRYENPSLAEVLRPFPREEVAWAAQKRLEEVVCEMISRLPWHKIRIVLAGGIFANVKLNQRIRELENVEKVYVFPNMGDGGLAPGAAWLAYRAKTGQSPEKAVTMLLGDDLEDVEIERSLKAAGLHFEKPRNISDCVAELLANNQVVARAKGKMEFGPRALGNRSILYHCKEKEVNQWLNESLSRSEFMPFAPVTLGDRAHEYYVSLEKGNESASFMTMTYDCTDRMVQECPAAVHVDKTARPQVVHMTNYPEMYQVISSYAKLTNRFSLINTSFNMHEEPIVCTASDAIRAFRASGLPWLALGNFLVQNKDASILS
jgi:carbamoyltransferase